MPTPQTQTDSGEQFIQYRGAQSSVTHDATGVHFPSEKRWGYYVQRALPVVDPDDPPEDVPPDAVALAVAREITDDNPLVCWGVACPVDGCDDVFDTPKGVSSHMAVHADSGGVSGPDGDADDDAGADE